MKSTICFLGLYSFLVFLLESQTLAAGYRPNRPEVEIRGVKDKQVIRVGKNVKIEAVAKVENDSIRMVDFYVNKRRAGRDFKAPYVWRWNNIPRGIYKFKVKAYSVRGRTSKETKEVVVRVE